MNWLKVYRIAKIILKVIKHIDEFGPEHPWVIEQLDEMRTYMSAEDPEMSNEQMLASYEVLYKWAKRGGKGRKKKRNT